jgi:phage recombination protein Bet
MAKEEKGVVKYESRGQEVVLTAEIVRNFLVTGKKELVTDQEIVYFLGICKGRQLNPFLKDCYLIKYSQDPAAIVVSIDFYRSRARAAKDCVGWEAGVICMDKKTQTLRYSKGLVLPTEELVGGWFKARPEGWNVDFELEVNLDGYIKKTSSGEITKFWRKENQPSQIRKVVESQGLRTVWPDLFSGTYTAEEMGYDLEKPLNITPQGGAEPAAGEPEPEVEAETEETKQFDKLTKQQLKNLKLDADTIKLKTERLAQYLTETAQSWRDQAKGEQKKKQMTVGYVKTRGIQNFDGLWTAFGVWEAAKFPDIAGRPETETKKEPIRGISAEQFDKLDSTPLEILQLAYKNCEVAIGLAPSELDFDTAAKLVAEVANIEASQNSNFESPGPGEFGPAQEPKVVTFTARAQTVFNELLQKGMPISELADLGVNGIADITAENIDAVADRVAAYRPKRGK